MAIDAYGNYATTYTDPTAASSATTENKTVLGKDDFLKLLLVELQYQDPTEPMDSEKILSQTSQLATLESTENTNTALENLTAALSASRDFSTISAIGKMADTGSNAIVFEEGSDSTFELFFADTVKSGTVSILDVDGNEIATMEIPEDSEGIASFDWDGKDKGGHTVDDGIYYVTASYTDASGVSKDTRVGLYPIEAVRFEEGQTLVKLGSSYVPFDSIQEVTEG